MLLDKKSVWNPDFPQASKEITVWLYVEQVSEEKVWPFSQYFF